MKYVQLLQEVSGNDLNVYDIGTITTIATKPVNTDRIGAGGLLFVIAGGTVANLVREVSIDKENFYTPYDNTGLNLGNISANVPNSRFIALNEVDSSGVLTPWTRFKFVGTGTITTVSVYFIGEEE